MHVTETELTLAPEEAVAAWPQLEPLAVMWSGGAAWRVRNPRCRWVILARPTDRHVIHAGPDASKRLRELFELMIGQGAPSASSLPFIGGWMGYISYDAGGSMEPAAPSGASDWPLALWQRCPDAYVHDRWTGQWYVVGDREALPELKPRRPRDGGEFLLGPLRSDTGRAAYTARVARIVQYIRDGDVFQANLAHRLSAPFEGSARALFLELCRRAQPWHGAYLEFDEGGERRAIASMSPELFLEYDADTRRVITRPMKGTRPRRVGGAGEAGLRDLARSDKDAAELNMIVDLMRNDLGRVAAYGSVQVEEGRIIETHGADANDGAADAWRGVLQGVATVSARLRDSCSLADLIGAAFPPGSVTGAPKIRAMQIIHELESSARGPYCGAIGYLSDHGRLALNVAIRSALIRGSVGGVSHDEIGGGELSFSVGAGIVADSRPEDEWQETLVKAGAIAALTSLKDT